MGAFSFRGLLRALLLIKIDPAGRRTPDAGRRTPDAGRRTPDAGRRTPDAGRPVCVFSMEPLSPASLPA